MSNYVFVLDCNKTPLAPCHPARARELLRKGKAIVLRRYPFVIQLKYTIKTPINNQFEIRIDPGSITTGISIISKGQRGDRCIISINLYHPRGKKISKDLTTRRSLRRNRRFRLRYRKPRFLNRRKSKGWLPPSVLHRVLISMTWIDRIMRFCPITSSRIEMVKFDTHKLLNPEVTGKQYQQGSLFRTEMRHYLLTAYNGKCQYCKGLSKKLYKTDFRTKLMEREHLTPRSRGGSDALSNATLSCRFCNEQKGNKTLKEFYEFAKKNKSEYYTQLKKTIPILIKGQKPTLKDQAVMNATRYRLRDYLKTLGLEPMEKPGWQTAYNRNRQKYRKDHWIDAACIGNQEDIVYIPNLMRPLKVTAMGHGNRKMCNHDAHGTRKIRDKQKLVERQRKQSLRDKRKLHLLQRKQKEQIKDKPNKAIQSKGKDSPSLIKIRKLRKQALRNRVGKYGIQNRLRKHMSLYQKRKARVGEKGPSRIFGYRTGDIVKAEIPKYNSTGRQNKYFGHYTGRIMIRSSGFFSLKTTLGLIPVSYRYLKRLHQNDGYTYAFGDPVDRKGIGDPGVRINQKGTRIIKAERIEGRVLYDLKSHIGNRIVNS